MVLPHEHVIRLYPREAERCQAGTGCADHTEIVIEAKCTCGDFSLEFPDGVDLSALEDSAPIRQHREFHANQDPMRQREQLISSTTSGAGPLLRNIAQEEADADEEERKSAHRQVRREAYEGSRILTDRDIYEASGLTQSQLAVARVAEVLDGRAQALRTEVQIKERRRRASAMSDPRPAAILAVVMDEFAHLAYTLDANYGWEPDR